MASLFNYYTFPFNDVFCTTFVIYDGGEGPVPGQWEVTVVADGNFFAVKSPADTRLRGDIE